MSRSRKESATAPSAEKGGGAYHRLASVDSVPAAKRESAEFREPLLLVSCGPRKLLGAAAQPRPACPDPQGLEMARMPKLDQPHAEAVSRWM